jgi:hypothetical protein
MKNVNLNPGGLIGAIGGVVIAGLTMLVISSYSSGPPKGSSSDLKSVFMASVIGGAFAGNFLWERFVKRSR